MNYRQLGRTGLQVSSVSIGTNQLRLLPPNRAIDVLLAGFERGMNFIHTSADYEGAETLVAKAVAEYGKPVIVASNAYDVHGNTEGDVSHFAENFERTCEIFDTGYLELYGIAAVEDREALGENVWGANGMLAFLRRMQKEGRLGHIFCTSHGEPAFVRRLIESDCFDAIMLSHNPLGFHLLSQFPPAGRGFENLPRTRLDLLPLCREKGVGVMAMMPMAGGLLIDSKAFPRRGGHADTSALSAGTILRSILADTAVSTAVVGTGSIEEAIENAEAGSSEPLLSKTEARRLRDRIRQVYTETCCRCGACEPLCSRSLPVSWLFRATEMAHQPAEAFESWPEVEYFHLHPDVISSCSRCEQRSCICPYGIDIPAELQAAHDQMRDFMVSARVNPPANDLRANRGNDQFGARIIVLDIPHSPDRCGNRLCRLYLENTGRVPWDSEHGTRLQVSVDQRVRIAVEPRWTIHRGGRGHFSFELEDSSCSDTSLIQLSLTDARADTEMIELFSGRLKQLRQLHRRSVRNLEALFSVRDSVYGVRWLEHNFPQNWEEQSVFYAYLKVQNSGSRRWLAASPGDGAGVVQMVVSLDGGTVGTGRLAADVPPGGFAVLNVRLALPSGLGDWVLEINFVEQQVARFDRRGVPPLRVSIRRLEAEKSPQAQALRSMNKLNPAFYIPTEGVARSRCGKSFPTIAECASAARVRDAEGNEWIDYVMGWGACLLGHAHPEITAAVSASLESGGIVNLPRQAEAEVAEQLCELIPCAEMVLFGKNGSDSSTAAVRTARVLTGRRKILFCGYHGWQEPFAGFFETALESTGSEPCVFRFNLNDTGGFLELVKQHADDLAAVMIEPAAQVEGVDGPIRDVDPGFLKQVAEITRERGAVLIFDEILTGFRYRKGSVQSATGVVPDLTCLGKGLSSGMPLSALVGRRKILAPSLSKLFYHPTFKSEHHSFAAARAALAVYRRIDVPRALEDFGRSLQDRVNAVSSEVGIDGRLEGMPFRMVYRFSEPDPLKRSLMRTLLQQELLLNGVMTFRGHMLPALAHGDAEQEQTITAFRNSLERVRDVAAQDAFAAHLQIPLID